MKRVIAVAVVLACAPATLGGSDWPQWRGPLGRGISDETDTGIMTCLDALTGAVVYEGGRVPVPATFTVSPVAIDDEILLTSEDGDTFVIRSGDRHEVLRTNSVGESVYASPAIADGRIFIRGERHLFVISRMANVE